MSEIKKRRGDRKDATLVRDADAMHKFMPFLLPNRTDNEAVLNDEIDVSKALEYIEKKNAENPDFKYTIFHFALAALAKTIYFRPYLNRFIQGHRLYMRDDISFTFVVKKKFEDRSEEGMVIMKVDPESEKSPIEQVHSSIEKKVNSIRRDNVTDGTTGAIEKLTKLPRPILKFVTKCLFFMDYHGIMPLSLQKDDPYYSSVFVTNLGSIKMSASYHHLANWGTNSVFVIVGEMKDKIVFDANGKPDIKKVLPFGVTADERIADGFYFAQSIKLLRKIFENPSILDETFDTKIDF